MTSPAAAPADPLADAKSTLTEILGSAEECELVVLDDAELAIFDDADREQAAPLRTLSELDDEATEQALTAAFERLVERELVFHDTVEGGTELSIAEPLVSLLMLRSVAPQVTLLECPHPAAPAFRVLYHHGDLIIDEHVDHGGTHRIDLRRHDTVAAALAEWLAPDELASATGAPATVHPDGDGWEELTASTVVGTLVRVVRTPQGVAEDYLAVRRLDDDRTAVTRSADSAANPEAALVQTVDHAALVGALTQFLDDTSK